MEFHHIGVATHDLEAAINTYKLLGYTLQGDARFEDPIQRVKLCFMSRAGHPLIELVAPNASDSPVSGVLAKNGSSPYHTCYEVDDIEKSISDLRAKKFINFGKPVPAIAFNNRLICFLLNREIGLIELLQKHK